MTDTPFDAEPTTEQLTFAAEFVRRTTRTLPGHNTPAAAIWDEYELTCLESGPGESHERI